MRANDLEGWVVRWGASVGVLVALSACSSGGTADAGTDTGPGADSGADASAGLDAGVDAGRDASGDAESGDASADAEVDASVDAGTDGAVDASIDAEADGAADASTDAGADASTDAGADASTDAGADADAGPTCPVCVPRPTGCGASEDCGPGGTGNGLDDDCNGIVDDGCACVPGTVTPCFAGPPGHRGVGACADGLQRCEGSSDLGTWGACTSGVFPGAETCDGLDDDCNGCIDESPSCCGVVPVIACPRSDSLPNAVPFQDYTINGDSFVSGVAASWSWRVTGTPCDELFLSTTAPTTTTFTLSGATTSLPTFHPTLSGAYTFTMTATTADGTATTCGFVVHARAPGLEIDLCSDRSGTTDLDLHLHRPGTTTSWFGPFATPNPDDCDYLTCRATSSATADWGLAPGPLAECANEPEGAMWSTIGSCRNPRLSIDSIDANGVPESMHVDAPRDGDRFRTLVHYYGGTGVTHPMVNVVCDGELVATYGAAPNTVPGFDVSGGYALGDMWRVGDVTTHVDLLGHTTCGVSPIHPPGMVSGYYVTTSVTSY